MWTDKNEEFLLELIEKTIIYKNAYHKKASLYNILNNVFSFTTLLLIPSSGTLAFTESTDFWNNDQKNYLSYIIGGINFISSGLILVNKTINFAGKSVDFKKTFENFLSIETAIKKELILEKEKREDSLTFIDRITKKYEETLKTAPIIFVDNFDNDQRFSLLKKHIEISLINEKKI